MNKKEFIQKLIEMKLIEDENFEINFIEDKKKEIIEIIDILSFEDKMIVLYDVITKVYLNQVIKPAKEKLIEILSSIYDDQNNLKINK